MFRKSNLRILIAVVGLLLVFVVIQQLVDAKKGERSFSTLIMDFDTARVTGLVMENYRPSYRLTRLYKEGTGWFVERDGMQYAADPLVVRDMLSGLGALRPERVAATERAQWGSYEVEDSTGLIIRILGKRNKEIAGGVIGKFSYQQPTNPYDRQGKLTTYVRAAGEDIVYAVDGFLQISFSDDLSSLRDKNILRDRGPESWTRLSFTFPGDSSFMMSRQGSRWLIDGLVTDSAAVHEYLSRLTPLTSSYFVYDTVPSGAPTHILTIEGDDMAGITIRAYPADTVNGYLVESSQNPEALFSGKEKNLFETLFKGRNTFLKR